MEKNMNDAENGKHHPVRVFGLSESELSRLRKIAADRYGKNSVSLLLKKTAQSLLEQPPEPEPVSLPPPSCRKRITVRLPDKDRAYLEETAKRRGGTVNDAVRDIVREHISRHPVLSGIEVDELHHSNYQLLSIGRNLNQIAHRLNAGEPVSLTSQYIADLRDIILRHIEHVGRVLHTQRRRQKGKE